MARLFIAVWLPHDVAATLTTLPREDRPGVRFVPPENWHVTMRFLGEAEPDEVIAALDGGTLPAARAHLGPAVEVLAKRALVVPVDGLDALAGRVTELTRQIGEPPRTRFVGHLTLARLKPPAGMTRLREPRPPVSAAFDVHEIALIRSRLERQGARYETITTWPVGTVDQASGGPELNSN